MKLKSSSYQPEFPTQSEVPPMPPTKNTQLFIVNIMFYNKPDIVRYDITKIETNNKDFIVVYQKDHTASFYNKANIAELHISPQEKE